MKRQSRVLLGVCCLNVTLFLHESTLLVVMAVPR